MTLKTHLNSYSSMYYLTNNTMKNNIPTFESFSTAYKQRPAFLNFNYRGPEEYLKWQCRLCGHCLIARRCGRCGNSPEVVLEAQVYEGYRRRYSRKILLRTFKRRKLCFSLITSQSFKNAPRVKWRYPLISREAYKEAFKAMQLKKKFFRRQDYEEPTGAEKQEYLEYVPLTRSQELSKKWWNKYPGQMTVDRLIKICVNDSPKEKEFFQEILEHSVDLVHCDNTKFNIDEIAVFERNELLNRLNIFFPVKLIKDLLKINKLNTYEGHYTQLKLSGGIVEVITKNFFRSEFFASFVGLSFYCFVAIVFYKLVNNFL